MAQSSITLTASMRSNLLSLKSIQRQMDTTQERLSTGKKVNSAIDNASSYYQSRSLSNRASDLEGLLDSMGQGIQTIQAANEGIEAVTTYVEQLKSIANSAFALDPTNSTYADSMKSYQDQYDTILKEMDKLVKDSSYQGINLLTGGKLTVTFNETRSNRFTVQGDDIMNEMALTKAESWQKTDSDYTVNKTTTEATEINKAVKFAEGGAAITVTTAGGDVKAVKVGDTKYYSTADGSDITDAVTAVGATGTLTAGEAATLNAKNITVATEVAAGQQVYNVDGAEAIKVDDVYYAVESGNAVEPTDPEAVTNATTKVQSYAASIDATLDNLSVAIDYLRSYATELGNNFSIIETRQDFTEALIDVLETGSDNLVLADMNEESANYLALQTRQQLAVNSLSLASQSAQSVLSLF